VTVTTARPAARKRSPATENRRRCVGVWVAAGLGSAQVVAPRFGRLLTWTLAAGAANAFLQTAFVAMNNKTEELAER